MKLAVPNNNKNKTHISNLHDRERILVFWAVRLLGSAVVVTDDPHVHCLTTKMLLPVVVGSLCDDRAVVERRRG
jgi:hypothetical protein